MCGFLFVLGRRWGRRGSWPAQAQVPGAGATATRADRAALGGGLGEKAGVREGHALTLIDQVRGRSKRNLAS